jgi:hypothetical protein
MNAKNALLIVVAIAALAGAILIGFGSFPINNMIDGNGPIYDAWRSTSALPFPMPTDGN